MTLELTPPARGMTDDERDLLTYHVGRLARFRPRNRRALAYYEGKQRVRNLGIAIPPNLRDVETVVGWPALTVNALGERLDWLGWTTSNRDLLGLDEIYAANALDVESTQGILDALIYGVGFAIVGAGDADEPHPLITLESPRRVTGEWDGRARRLSSALSIDAENDYHVPTQATLYLPDRNVVLARDGGFGKWEVVDRDDHDLGRVLVAALPNQARPGRPFGRSEITRPIRSLTDQGVRTLLGMEVHREFYQAPQRYALGADETQFQRADGSVATGWEAVMGRFLAIPRDDDGEVPEIGQFTPASPTPYLEQVRGLAQLVAAEAAVPAAYLGFITDNPASADAIRAAEARLVKRAERRQAILGRGFREVGALALLVRDGSIPDEYRAVGSRWRDPATPTRAAAADEALKLVAAGILPATSQVTLDRLGFTPQEQAIIRADREAAPADTPDDEDGGPSARSPRITLT